GTPRAAGEHVAGLRRAEVGRAVLFAGRVHDGGEPCAFPDAVARRDVEQDGAAARHGDHLDIVYRGRDTGEFPWPCGLLVGDDAADGEQPVDALGVRLRIAALDVAQAAIFDRGDNAVVEAGLFLRNLQVRVDCRLLE